MVPETLEELEALPCETLTCKQVAKILNISEHLLHNQAVADPSVLGFPIIRCRTRVRIPKTAFLKYLRGEIV